MMPIEKGEWLLKRSDDQKYRDCSAVLPFGTHLRLLSKLQLVFQDDASTTALPTHHYYYEYE